MPMILTCPGCNSANVKPGKVLGYSDGPCMASVFRPETNAAVVASEGLAIDCRFCACADCGLLWQILPRHTREALPRYAHDNIVI